MKRYIKSALDKKRKISSSEYSEAVEVGKKVLQKLHSRYPDVFPTSQSKSIRRRSAWSECIYVLFNTGIDYDDISSYDNIDAEIKFCRQYEDIINQEILPELGIDTSDFWGAIDIDYHNGSVVNLVIYDRNRLTFE